MKLKIFSALIILAVSVNAFAGVSSIQSATFVNASGSTSASVVIPATSTAPGAGNRVVIDNITAYGDVATCFIKILEGDAAGVTTSFTEKVRLDLGDATLTYPKATTTGPLFIGQPNYQYKITVETTTTANSAVVNFRLASLQEQL